MPSSSRLVQGCLPRLGRCTPGLGSLVRRAMSTRLSLKMSPVPSKTSGSRRGTRTGTKDSGALDSRSKTSGSLMSDEHIAKEGSNASDKFVVGVIGASLMIVQVVVLIAGLTSWLKVVNTDLDAELLKASIDEA
ncbi:unnamed protein product [Symbiodinium necroappetens]|uniref:Uncharacterized protein n=1 Tax=Symbiodinium necroappetens TaxID=1628268 RepID=A0A813BQ35_9DINO|nr:unnamed protein product [Symbiodinium necroappetens]